MKCSSFPTRHLEATLFPAIDSVVIVYCFFYFDNMKSSEQHGRCKTKNFLCVLFDLTLAVCCGVLGVGASAIVF